MKNFKDLTPTQKKRAIDRAFDLKAQDLAKGTAGKSFSKLPAAKQKELLDGNGNFCGCYGCQVFVKNAVKKDAHLKEFILGEAQVEAENAYYQEPTDTVIAVD